MIYFIILIILLIPIILYDFWNLERGWRFWFYAELLIFILLAGLRYRVGADSMHYINFFEDYPTFPELFGFDFSSARFYPLWYVFNSIIKSIYNDFTFFQILHAIIINSVFFWFFRKYTKYFFTSILIYYISYFLLYNTEVLREALSVCVFMLSTEFLLNKKYIKYYICCFVAFGFHQSAMILFAIPILLLIPRFNWKITLLSFLGLTVVLGLLDLTSILNSVFNTNAVLSSKTEAYTTNNFFKVFNINGTLSLLVPVMFMIFANYKKEEPKVADCEEICLSDKTHNFLFLFAILICFTMFVPIMFIRMTNYLAPFYVIILLENVMPVILPNSDENRLSLRSLLIVFAMLWFLFFAIRTYWNDDSDDAVKSKFYDRYYPYHSIFDKEIEQKREPEFNYE